MKLNKQTFKFLKWLEEFNDRKFFELYKPLYLIIKEDFEIFVDYLIQQISKFDDDLIWIESKKCIYRIYKDMRFPRNRENPYKTNLWAHISFNRKRLISVWYYLHIENNQSFFWGWIYAPTPTTANNIRKYIYKNRSEFEKIINNKIFIKTFWHITFYRPILKRLPKEFDLNHPSIEYLKFKDRLVYKKIKNWDFLWNNLNKNIIKNAKIFYPLKNFLNKAMNS
jgi:uncharacterized protein (TIGR02453 family)